MSWAYRNQTGNAYHSGYLVKSSSNFRTRGSGVRTTIEDYAKLSSIYCRWERVNWFLATTLPWKIPYGKLIEYRFDNRQGFIGYLATSHSRLRSRSDLPPKYVRNLVSVNVEPFQTNGSNCGWSNRSSRFPETSATFGSIYPAYLPSLGSFPGIQKSS